MRMKSASGSLSPGPRFPRTRKESPSTIPCSKGRHSGRHMLTTRLPWSSVVKRPRPIQQSAVSANPSDSLPRRSAAGWGFFFKTHNVLMGLSISSSVCWAGVAPICCVGGIVCCFVWCLLSISILCYLVYRG